MRKIWIILLTIPSFIISNAQDYKIDSASVATLDATIKSLYEVISGPAGPRDWPRLRGLCTSNCQFNAVAKNKEGGSALKLGDVEEYIKNATPFFDKNGFYESEISRSVDQFSHIAQVFSTYESRFEEKGEVFARGINSIQLVWDTKRWWVANVLWNAENQEEPIPKQYLK